MAEIAPLTPLRYNLAKLPGGLASVVAPPYDVIGEKERTRLVAKVQREGVENLFEENLAVGGTRQERV